MKIAKCKSHGSIFLTMTLSRVEGSKSLEEIDLTVSLQFLFFSLHFVF